MHRRVTPLGGSGLPTPGRRSWRERGSPCFLVVFCVCVTCRARASGPAVFSRTSQNVQPREKKRGVVVVAAKLFFRRAADFLRNVKNTTVNKK